MPATVPRGRHLYFYPERRTRQRAESKDLATNGDDPWLARGRFILKYLAARAQHRGSAAFKPAVLRTRR